MGIYLGGFERFKLLGIRIFTSSEDKMAKTLFPS